MDYARGAALAAAAWTLTAATAASARDFNVPAGPLGKAAGVLAVQAGVTIAINDPAVAARRSPGVHGSMSFEAALARMTRGTRTRLIFHSPKVIEIVAAASPARPRAPRPAVMPPPVTVADPEEEIVVTGSKQRFALSTYPGAVWIRDLDPGSTASHASDGVSAIERLTPSLSSTDLGPARDKMFIRGVADSSFSGAMQATSAAYLGEVRLNYAAPDPDVNLYDLQRVEVLSGPQGTLYGAGSLGGLIRLIPAPPDVNTPSTSLSAGLLGTSGGGTGVDAAAMLNVPLVEGRLAARSVITASREPGYIDNPLRGKTNINRTDRFGLRTTLRLATPSGWTIDLGSVLQNISSLDSQYTLRESPTLTRDSLIDQPFRSRYLLAFLNARRALGGAELVTTTSAARHRLHTVYEVGDLFAGAGFVRFDDRNLIQLVQHDTRLSGGSTREPWVAGVAGVFSHSKQSRAWSGPSVFASLPGVVNDQLELALYGQATRSLTSTLSATLGARATLTHSYGLLLGEVENGPELSRTAPHLATSAALGWSPAESLFAYLRFQEGYRAGGLGLASDGTRLIGKTFASDDLDLFEAGVRLHDGPAHRLSVNLAAFLVDWRNIQGDIIDLLGNIYPSNLGRGRVLGLDAAAVWRPIATLTLNGGIFLNDARIVELEPDYAGLRSRRLPNIAGTGGRLSAEYRTQLSDHVSLTTSASLRYIGKSDLGIAPSLFGDQGDYLLSDVSLRVLVGTVGISLDIDNLANVRANSFAFGNPFSALVESQITPVRPRRIRIGIDFRR